MAVTEPVAGKYRHRPDNRNGLLCSDISNGPMEATNQKIKMVRRRSYGRTGLELLNALLVLAWYYPRPTARSTSAGRAPRPPNSAISASKCLTFRVLFPIPVREIPWHAGRSDPIRADRAPISGRFVRHSIPQCVRTPSVGTCPPLR